MAAAKVITNGLNGLGEEALQLNSRNLNDLHVWLDEHAYIAISRAHAFTPIITRSLVSCAKLRIYSTCPPCALKEPTSTYGAHRTPLTHLAFQTITHV